MYQQSLDTKSTFQDLKMQGVSAEQTVRLADLRVMLPHRVKLCPSFGLILKEAILKSADRQLTLVLYHDSVTPGNVLQPNPERKSTLIYCSFAELGSWLSKESCWLTIGLVTDASLAKISDGMSALMCKIMERLAEPGNLLHSGASFVLEEQVWQIIVRNVCFVADEAAIKQTWSNKGASGLRPCLFCQNVVKIRTETEVVAPFIHLSDGSYTEFQQMSDADVFLLADNISEIMARGASIKKVQKFSGLTYAPNGLLWNRNVRGLLGPNCANFDPMHIYFSSGIFGYETAMLFDEIEALHKNNQCMISAEHFVQFVSSIWETPALPSCQRSIASERKRAASLVIKDRGTASQQLGMWPLLDCFVRTSFVGHLGLKPKVDSYLQLCAVIRAVRRAKECPLQSDIQILDLQRTYMQLFVAAYGRKAARPKHHYQFHLGKQALRWGTMLDCWVTERKHRAFKKVTTLLGRNQRFEIEALSMLIRHEEQLMVDHGFQDGLSKQVLTSSGKVFHKGTCLLFLKSRPELFLVKGFVSDGGQTDAIGELWELVATAAC